MAVTTRDSTESAAGQRQIGKAAVVQKRVAQSRTGGGHTLNGQRSILLGRNEDVGDIFVQVVLLGKFYSIHYIIKQRKGHDLSEKLAMFSRGAVPGINSRTGKLGLPARE